MRGPKHANSTEPVQNPHNEQRIHDMNKPATFREQGAEYRRQVLQIIVCDGFLLQDVSSNYTLWGTTIL
jgi:hypothetical protein